MRRSTLTQGQMCNTAQFYCNASVWSSCALAKVLPMWHSKTSEAQPYSNRSYDCCFCDFRFWEDSSLLVNFRLKIEKRDITRPGRCLKSELFEMARKQMQHVHFILKEMHYEEKVHKIVEFSQTLHAMSGNRDDIFLIYNIFPEKVQIVNNLRKQIVGGS